MEARFPFVAVRDLLGILRALWLSVENEGQRRRIAAVAHDLRAAYELALTSTPGTMGYKSAWRRAEQATHKVGDLVELYMSLDAVLGAAAAQVTNELGPRRKKPATH